MPSVQRSSFRVSVAREVARLVEQLGPERAAVLQFAVEQHARLFQLAAQLLVGAFEFTDVPLHLARAPFEEHHVEVEHTGYGGQRERENEGGVKLHGFLPLASLLVGFLITTPSRAFAQVPAPAGYNPTSSNGREPRADGKGRADDALGTGGRAVLHTRCDGRRADDSDARVERRVRRAGRVARGRDEVGRGGRQRLEWLGQPRAAVLHRYDEERV